MNTVLFPNKVLLTPCKPVTVVNEEVRKIYREMFAHMLKEGGVGLAANQVGIDMRIITVCYEDFKAVLINPSVDKEMTSKETNEAMEGCLSFPGLQLKVSRPSKLSLYACPVYMEKDNQEYDYQAIPHRHYIEHPYIARIISHEIDHLDGLTYLDRISKLKRDLIKKKLRRFV